MKLFLMSCFFIIGVASCASPEKDLTSRNKIYFVSKSKLIDVVSLHGVDLGEMYRPSSEAVTSKNFGKKGYTTYDGIKVSKEIIIK